MAGSSFLPPTAQTATASDLVRHFGEWQRRAALAPVYVLHHRRPQFVLASIEFLQALSASTRAPASDEVARILDALAEPVLIVTREGAILVAGRAARLCLGARAIVGGRLDEALGPEAAEQVASVVERVATSGLAERFELPGREGAPWLTLTIEPHSAGVIIVGRAAGVEVARDAALAQVQAMASAIAALPGAALATIDLRGRLIAPDESLARLTGKSRDALAAMSASAMFAPSSRQAIEQAIDDIFAGLPVACVKSTLLAENAKPIAVTLGLAPLLRGLQVTAVQAAIVKRG